MLQLTNPTDLQHAVCMPRSIRIEFAGAVYHVMARGNRRDSIFLDDEDRRTGKIGVRRNILTEGPTEIGDCFPRQTPPSRCAAWSRTRPRRSPRASGAGTRAACAPLEIVPPLRRAVARLRCGVGHEGGLSRDLLARKSGSGRKPGQKTRDRVRAVGVRRAVGVSEP